MWWRCSRFGDAQEKKDRNDEVEEILKRQCNKFLRPPKNVITPEEIEEVRKMQDVDPDKAKEMMEKLRRLRQKRVLR